jgi:hypothetical protein
MNGSKGNILSFRPEVNGWIPDLVTASNREH